MLRLLYSSSLSCSAQVLEHSNTSTPQAHPRAGSVQITEFRSFFELRTRNIELRNMKELFLSYIPYIFLLNLIICKDEIPVVFIDLSLHH